MKPIKFFMLGADGFTCQMPRIRESILNLGHIISEDFPDLIYANDPTGYVKALSLKKKFPKSFLILNFLDIPWHLPNVKKQTELLVEHFLNKAGVKLTDFNGKRPGFSGSHDATLALVQSGSYQVGALNEQVWISNIEKGRVDLSKSRVIW